MAAAMPVVLLLALLVVGLLQGRANTDDPALLRYKAWQPFVALLVGLGFVAQLPLPHLSVATVVLPVCLAATLVSLLWLRRRRAAAHADVDF